MATLLIRWLITWFACAFMAAKAAGDSTDNDKPLYTETKEFLKKRIMEEEVLVRFLNQLSKISRSLQQQPNNRRLASTFPDTAAKRIGSEFLGKRLMTNAAALDATDDDVTEAVTKAEILANQLLNFKTNKRLGSEFLGKRKFIGSEFVGKRAFNEHNIIATTVGQTSNDSDDNNK